VKLYSPRVDSKFILPFMGSHVEFFGSPPNLGGSGNAG